MNIVNYYVFWISCRLSTDKLSIKTLKSSELGFNSKELGSNQLNHLSISGKMLITQGVGHRLGITFLYSNNKLKENFYLPLLSADVGTSEPICYMMPNWVISCVDMSSTKLHILDMLNKGLVNPYRGNNKFNRVSIRSSRVLSRRPRSPYTGQGIIRLGVSYPKLKQTKSGKK
jgi:hypothetical protein